MSDFLDILNAHSGQLNLIAYGQRNQLAENQRKALLLQLRQVEEQIGLGKEAGQQSKRMEEAADQHHKRMEEHAARLEQLEKQRLEIEQHRLQLQAEQDASKHEEANVLRERRKLLSETIIELESLRGKHSSNQPPLLVGIPERIDLTLTLRLALLQSIAEFLTKEDVFNDLADIQAFDRYRRDLTNFSRTEALQGHTKDNPLKFACKAIEQRSSVLKETTNFIVQCRHPATRLNTNFHPSTYNVIQNILYQATKNLDGLTDSLKSLVTRYRIALEFFNVRADSDDLRHLAKFSAPFSEFLAIIESSKIAENDLIEFYEGRGVLYRELTASLTSVIKKCREWHVAAEREQIALRYESDRLEIERNAKINNAFAQFDPIKAQIAAGNYRRADYLYNSLPEGVRGSLKFQDLSREIEVIKAFIIELISKLAMEKSAKSRTILEAHSLFRKLELVQSCENDFAASNHRVDIEHLREAISREHSGECRNDALSIIANIETQRLGRDALRTEAKAIQHKARLRFGGYLFCCIQIMIGLILIFAGPGSWADITLKPNLYYFTSGLLSFIIGFGGIIVLVKTEAGR